VADLVLVETDVAFAGLEVLLDPPALPGHSNQIAQRDAVVVAAVVGKLAGGVVAAYQQPVVASAARFGFDRRPGPGVVAVVALGSGTGGEALPGEARAGQVGGQVQHLGS